METKQMYATGNLFTGAPYGVATEDHFDNRELHGPFASENDADTYMHQLVGEFDDYTKLTVVRIETPRAGRSIFRASANYDYAV